MILARVLLTLTLFLASCSNSEKEGSQFPAGGSVRADRTHSLEKILQNAMGDLEGTIVVIDPRSGVVGGVWNRRLAFEQPFPPGSAIKPFTLLAAFRSGVVDRDSRRVCAGQYVTSDFQIVCSHPRILRPIDPIEALAYSCNDYFAHVGERMSESAFLSTLAAFGFGERTGVNASNEARGLLQGGDSGARKAVGESDTLLVTPIQLLVAYSALFNGGRVYRPLIEGRVAESPFHLNASLKIPEQHRELIENGMEGAVRFGTAAQAGFQGDLPRVFGKTGTSTSSNGFRTQGWFIGFAGSRKVPSIGIVVLLKRAIGREAAKVAARVLSALKIEVEREARPEMPVRTIRVQIVSDRRTMPLPLERYIAGVLTTEYSIEKNLEALKAHAIASRSYALSNLGRHAGEGFDFCSLTHCQRFSLQIPTPAQSQAVEETGHMILNDPSGHPIEALFHADCGGSTTSATALWGFEPRSYLREVRDEHCENHSLTWTDRIQAHELARALAGDTRSNVGGVLRAIRITNRDDTGRAEWLVLEGERTKAIRGWDFKLIVGRSLGWNLIKSSQFEVSREGESFVFNGRGHGHGLGMCQTGAGAMASQGVSCKDILGHYYPGTTIGYESSGRRSMASERFRVSFSTSTLESDVREVLDVLEAARADLERRLEESRVGLTNVKQVDVTICASTASYVSATGMPGWTAGVTRDRKIVTQPVSLLKKRGVLVTALRHEYAHTVIEALGRGSTPRWLAEGLAAYFAGEGPQLVDAIQHRSLPVDELERRIRRVSSAAEMKALYAQAYRDVRSMILAEGEAKMWRTIAHKIPAKARTTYVR